MKHAVILIGYATALLLSRPICALEIVRMPIEPRADITTEPLLFEDHPRRSPQGSVVIVGGMGEGRQQYSKLMKLVRKQGYSSYMFVQRTEANDFDGDYPQAVRDFDRLIRKVRFESRGLPVHLIIHSMAFAVIEKWIQNHGSHFPEIGSVTYSNPLLSNGHLMPNEEIDKVRSNPKQDRVKLTVHLRHRNRIYEVVTSRTVGFIIGYLDLIKEIRANVANRPQIPTQFLISADDPVIDRRLVEVYAQELRATGIPVDLVTLKLNTSDVHNIWRAPDISWLPFVEPAAKARTCARSLAGLGRQARNGDRFRSRY